MALTIGTILKPNRMGTSAGVQLNGLSEVKILKVLDSAYGKSGYLLKVVKGRSHAEPRWRSSSKWGGYSNYSQNLRLDQNPNPHILKPGLTFRCFQDCWTVVKHTKTPQVHIPNSKHVVDNSILILL